MENDEEDDFRSIHSFSGFELFNEANDTTYDPELAKYSSVNESED